MCNKPGYTGRFAISRSTLSALIRHSTVLPRSRDCWLSKLAAISPAEAQAHLNRRGPSSALTLTTSASVVTVPSAA